MKPSTLSLVSAFVLAIVLQSCHSADDRQFVTVATDLFVPAGQSTVNAPVPLETPSNTNEVCLTPAVPYRVDLDRWELVTPGGASVVPRVRVSGRKSTVELTNLGSYGQDLCFTAGIGAEMAGPYDTVHLQSTVELRLAKVEWHSTHK